MKNLFKIAFRNLVRYRRRTLMTSLLITIGVFAVVVFGAVAGSFRQMMVGQITDSMLGHVQVHNKGYVASLDNLPLNMMLGPDQLKEVEQLLDNDPNVEAYSSRVKFGSVFSNFIESTNIRMNAVEPDKEAATCPLLVDRLVEGNNSGPLLKKGEILIPELLAAGLKIKLGDTAVLVANNKDGSVNGMQFIVVGILEGITGPGGKDGYMHIEDAQILLRMDKPEVSEIAIRLKDNSFIPQTKMKLKKHLGSLKNDKGEPIFEVHGWQALTPFSNIAKIIDLLTVFINIMLVAIVLVSVMNVMVMAVYERIKEIGTISAIGTLPGKIMAMFVVEGFLMGIFGTLMGVILSLTSIILLNTFKLTFDFGRQAGLVLEPQINLAAIILTSVLVILVSVAASLQPAYRASRMRPVDALRHV
jgi:putative ABC transport system permease protein